MTTPNEEIEAWLAIRKEAAKAIDPATAKVIWEHGQVARSLRDRIRIFRMRTMHRPELLRARARFGRVGFVSRSAQVGRG